MLDKLRADPDVNIPVWHDDQQGTASVTLAGLINALKIVGKKKSEVKIVFNGIGASNFAISRLLRQDGFDLEKAIFVDSKGILYRGRKDLLLLLRLTKGLLKAEAGCDVPYDNVPLLITEADQKLGENEWKLIDISIRAYFLYCLL